MENSGIYLIKLGKVSELCDFFININDLETTSESLIPIYKFIKIYKYIRHFSMIALIQPTTNPS